MTQENFMSQITASLVPTVDPQPIVDFATNFADSLVRTQKAQWSALLAWQAALADCQNELWDEWICRWGGGAPFDA
jgi:hypothetical protein